jgi:recombinational DNA repair protein (RecF pathway)
MLYLSKIARTFYCRLRIPKDLHVFFPKLEIKLSLKTCRYKEARVLLTNFSAQAERVFTMIRSGALTDKMIRKIVDEFLDNGVRLFEAQRDKEKIFDNAENQQFVEENNERLSRMMQLMKDMTW